MTDDTFITPELSLPARDLHSLPSEAPVPDLGQYTMGDLREMMRQTTQLNEPFDFLKKTEIRPGSYPDRSILPRKLDPIPGCIEHIGDPKSNTSFPGVQPTWTVPNYSNLTSTGAWSVLTNAHGRGDTYTYTTTGKVKVTFSGAWGFNGTQPFTSYLAIEPCSADGTYDMAGDIFPEHGRDWIRYMDVWYDTGSFRGFHHERIYTVTEHAVGIPIKWGTLMFISAANLYINTEGSGANGQFYFQFFPDDGESLGWIRN